MSTKLMNRSSFKLTFEFHYKKKGGGRITESYNVDEGDEYKDIEFPKQSFWFVIIGKVRDPQNNHLICEIDTNGKRIATKSFNSSNTAELAFYVDENNPITDQNVTVSENDIP